VPGIGATWWQWAPALSPGRPDVTPRRVAVWVPRLPCR